MANVSLLFELKGLPRIRRALCKCALSNMVDSTTRSGGWLHCLADEMVRKCLNFRADLLGVSSLGVIDLLLPTFVTSALQTALNIVLYCFEAD